MEITGIRIFKVNGKKLKGYVTVIFDNAFIVRDLKIINGNSGLFVTMPNKRKKNGRYKDIAHPLNKEMRDVIEKKIIDQYKNDFLLGQIT